MSDLAILRAELQALRAEEAKLVSDSEELSAKLRTVNTRLQELRGSWCQGGLIKQAHSDYKRAEARERDKQLPRVVWQREPEHSEKELVLVKATPKRLFVRGIGCPHCSQYDRSTGLRAGRADNGRSGIIDVSKTLGESND